MPTITGSDTKIGMDQKPTIAEIIDKLGGATIAAKQLNLASPSVVLNWRLRNSIPAQYVIAIEKITGIARESIRPDVFGEAHRFSPVVRYAATEE